MENKETLEEVIDREYKEAGHNAYFGNGFKRGVTWQTKRSYTEDEVLDLLLKVGNILESSSRVSYYTEKRIKEWFGQLKKK